MHLTDEIDLQLMREIAVSPATTQRGPVQRLGVSLGRVNYGPRLSTGRGLVKTSNFRRNNNKSGYASVQTPESVEELRLPLSSLQCKMVEYYRLQLEALRSEVESAAQPGPAQQQRATPPAEQITKPLAA